MMGRHLPHAIKVVALVAFLAGSIQFGWGFGWSIFGAVLLVAELGS